MPRTDYSGAGKSRLDGLSAAFAILIAKRRNPLLADIKAQRDSDTIIIAEAKCFEMNTPDELYTALGQYLVYRSLINRMRTVYPLYLVIPATAFHGIFDTMGMGIVQEVGIKLIVVDIETEVIEKWLE
jgi:hypothetical protein